MRGLARQTGTDYKNPYHFFHRHIPVTENRWENPLIYFTNKISSHMADVTQKLKIYLIILILIIGCDSAKMHQVGEAYPPIARPGSKKSWIVQPHFWNSESLLSGRAGQVCQHMGCWFVLQDSTQHILIDLEQGRTITVPAYLWRLPARRRRRKTHRRRSAPDGKGVEIHRKRAKIWSFFNL